MVKINKNYGIAFLGLILIAIGFSELNNYKNKSEAFDNGKKMKAVVLDKDCDFSRYPSYIKLGVADKTQSIKINDDRCLDVKLGDSIEVRYLEKSDEIVMVRISEQVKMRGVIFLIGGAVLFFLSVAVVAKGGQSRASRTNSI